MLKPKSQIELLYDRLCLEYPLQISLSNLRKATANEWKAYIKQISAMAELEREIRWDNQERKKRQAQYNKSRT